MMKLLKIIVLASVMVGLCIGIFFKKQSSLVNNEKRGVFISYIEHQKYLRGKDIGTAKSNIDQIINKLSSHNFNMIILQVRPFSDAIYNSQYFMTSKTVVSHEGDSLPFDILQYYIEKAHQKGIEVHAWINPYRIRSDSDFSTLNKNSIIYQWIVEKSNNVDTTNGLYLNPASAEVQQLILEGVKEIIDNYDIDGIHYDDYFYPQITVDKVMYQPSFSYETLIEFRCAIINKLLKDTYNLVKNSNKNIVFGISPQGNINNNKRNEYLDIEYILTHNGYIDYVMPQIYFGFNNESKPFISTLNEWQDLIQSDVALYVALAAYKTGKEDKYAKGGQYEWLESQDILKRQVLVVRNTKHYQGFTIFRYDSLFAKESEELENLQTILKK